MEAYIARQPIFDAKRNTIGYELLYRDKENFDKAVITDGSQATSRLLSDAINLFGLPNLTNAKPAFVNFTEILIMNNFVYLANPNDVVVEVPDSTDINRLFLNKLKELKGKGYKLALDDYTGSMYYKEMLALVDYLKVDFMATDEKKQNELTVLPREYPQINLLAERVETNDVFERARKQGYKFFQGYFFSKPMTLQKKVPQISLVTYARAMNEINRKSGLDFSALAKVIHKDAVLTYRTLQKAHTLRYYRGNLITAVQSALVMMGEEEIRRWIILMLARDNNVTGSDEIVKQAYLRGCFAKQLMEQGKQSGDSEYAFLAGMFSLMDRILGLDMDELLENIIVPVDVHNALLHTENTIFTKIIDYVSGIESGLFDISLEDMDIGLNEDQVAMIYMKCMEVTDDAFTDLE